MYRGSAFRAATCALHTVRGRDRSRPWKRDYNAKCAIAPSKMPRTTPRLLIQALGVLRTRRLIGDTSSVRGVPDKTDRADAKPLQDGAEERLFQIARVIAAKAPERDLRRAFPFEHLCNVALKRMIEYSLPARGMRRTRQGAFSSRACARKASRRSRLMRFLTTLLPYFFPTQTANFSRSDGKKTMVRLSACARFPARRILENSFSF